MVGCQTRNLGARFERGALEVVCVKAEQVIYTGPALYNDPVFYDTCSRNQELIDYSQSSLVDLGIRVRETVEECRW